MSTHTPTYEEALRKLNRELTLRNRLAEIFLTAPDEDMYREVLEVILEAMESRHGIFGYIAEDGSLVCPSITRDVWDQCQIPDKDIVFPRERWGGIWGRALIERKTLCSNELLAVPEGHIPIRRVLVVPILHQGEVIGVLEAANKPTDYDGKDHALLETIAGSIAPILDARLQRDRQERERKRAEEALRKLNEELERRVLERTAELEAANQQLTAEMAERREAEKALRESEEKYRQVFAAESDAIMILDAETREVVDANDAALSLYGYTREEFLKLRLAEITAEPEKTRQAAAQTAEGRPTRIALRYHRKKDGTAFPVETAAGTFVWRGRRVLFGVIRDITERKRAEQELQYRVQLERLIMGISTRFIHLLPDEVDNEINRALRELGQFGAVDCTRVTVLTEDGQTIESTHEWCAEGIEPKFHRIQGMPAAAFPWAGAKLARMEAIHISRVADLGAEARSAKELWQATGVRSILVVPIACGRALFGSLGFATVRAEKTWSEDTILLVRTVGEIFANALERKRAQQKVLAYQGQLRSLASELSVAEERERRRIASDLHDHVGQDLSALKLRLELLRRTLPAGHDTGSLDEPLDLLGKVIHDAWSLMAELSPPFLYEIGLTPALEWLVEQFQQRHGLAVEFEDDGEPRALDDEARALVFHAVRELLNNVAKHAQARRAKVAVRNGGGHVTIRVEDDGIGFDVSQVGPRSGKAGGFGLFNIRERLYCLGGRLELESAPGRGSAITLLVPPDRERRPVTEEP